jgi:hypothetical protein
MFFAAGREIVRGVKGMECPVCGCQEFYIKDPDDEFETYEFSVAEGEVRFSAGAEGKSAEDVQETTPTFCNRCAWHGKLEELKKS